MESMFERVKTFFLAEGLDKTYWIAYSGGLDSHVLLHVCAEIGKTHPLSVRAIHINHQLSHHAANWAAHCAKTCHDLQIPLVQKEIEAKSSSGESPEEAARIARYAVFAELLSVNDYLLTAHQQDDQAETVLLQLLRGAGLKGLSAMPLIKPFAKGVHARPLLNFSRADLKKYAEEQRLSWIDDESNLDIGYTRNFLRHEVLPILTKRWPSVTKTLSRVATHCAEAQSILDSLAKEDLTQLYEENSRSEYAIPPLNIKKLLELSPERQSHVLREWIHQSDMPLPSAVKMLQIQHYFLQAGHDKSPHIIWGDVELRRYQNKLYLMKCLPVHDTTQVHSWDMQKPLMLSSDIILHATLAEGLGLRADLSQVEVRFRQGGERCRLPGRKEHHDLKKLFQQWKVPPWQRERIPLLYIADKLVAVVGFFIDEEYLASRSQNGYIVNMG